MNRLPLQKTLKMDIDIYSDVVGIHWYCTESSRMRTLSQTSRVTLYQSHFMGLKFEKENLFHEGTEFLRCLPRFFAAWSFKNQTGNILTSLWCFPDSIGFDFQYLEWICSGAGFRVTMATVARQGEQGQDVRRHLTGAASSTLRWLELSSTPVRLSGRLFKIVMDVGQGCLVWCLEKQDLWDARLSTVTHLLVGVMGLI